MTIDDDKPGSALEEENETLEAPPTTDPEFEQRLEQLKIGLQRIRSGDLPCGAELEGLPLLDHWAISIEGPVRRLVGVVSNHPRLQDGWITTSPLIFISDDKKLARTVSRFYRLATPLVDRGAKLSR